MSYQDEEFITPKKKKRVSQKKKKRRRRKMMIFAVELILLFLVVSGLYVVTRWDRIQKPSFGKADLKINELNEDVIASMEGSTTIAAFGVDARDNTSLDKGNRSDTIMIININHETGEVKIASVYRDTYLNVSDDNDYGKINGAYNTGGPKNAINALNKNLDLQIDKYVTVNWYAVAQAIDLLGGIEIDISEDLIYNKANGNMMNGYITEIIESTGLNSPGVNEPGLQTLNGVQAVAYSRIRYVSGGDYTRAQHQREVLQLMFQKAKSMDITKLPAMIETVFPNIATNLEMTEALSLALSIAKYDITDMTGFPFDKTAPERGEELYGTVVPLGLEQNVAKLHEFLYGAGENYTASPTLKKISDYIESSTGYSYTGE